MLNAVIFGGAGLTVLGILGIFYSVILVRRARAAAGDDDAALKARLEKIIPINIGALFVSFLGLIAVLVGVILS